MARVEIREVRAAANGGGKPPTKPIGHPDVLWGLPGQGGLLTEWAESVPDLTWPESTRTYGRMRRDGRLSAVLKAFFYPVLRANWVVDPAGARDEAAALVAADVGLPILGQKGDPPAAAIPGFSWFDHLRLALNNLVFGFMPFERWFTVTGGRTHLAGVAERQPHTVSMIDIGDNGLVNQVWQNTQEDPIPARNMTWYVNEREGANWAGVSLLRPCYSAWVLKHETLRVHATSIRRWGMGVPNVIAPPGATPAQITQAQQLAAGMRAGDTAGAGLPNGFEFRLSGISGSVPDAVAFLGYLNQEMTTSALAQIVELAQSAHGSRAVGDSFLDLFLLSLQAVADAVSATVTFGDQAMPGLCRSLVEYNWGQGEAVPRIIAKDVGDQHEVSAASIAQLVTSGALAPDEGLDSFIRQAWGLPDHVPIPAPPPGMMAPAGKGGAPGAWWQPPVPKPPPPPAAPAPGRPGTGGQGGSTNAPAPGGGTPGKSQPAPSGGQQASAAASPGLARAMTPAEEAAGLDPEGMRHDLDMAASRVYAQWQPVLTAQRQDLADQVTAAVDDGHLDQLARLTAPTDAAAQVLYRGMSAMAQLAAGRMCAEAAAQGVEIPPGAVYIDQDRLRQLAAARAVMAGNYLAAQASRQALQAVTVHATAEADASAGSRAAHIVQVVLSGLSVRNLADQLLAALHAAQNMGRIAAGQAGLDMGNDARFIASEIHDSNTCGPCLEIDGTTFPTMEAAQEAYPAGGFAGCDGRERCRGTVIADWGPGEITITGPDGQELEAASPKGDAADLAAARRAAGFDERLHPRRPGGGHGGGEFSRDGGGGSGQAPDALDMVGRSEAFFKAGTEFELAPARPAGLKMGPAKQCYANAAQCAIDHRYRYCEGFALSPQIGYWVHHAWNTDADGRAFDLTWRKPGSRYVGRAYDTMDVLDRAADRGLYDAMADLLTLLPPDLAEGTAQAAAGLPERLEAAHAEAAALGLLSGQDARAAGTVWDSEAHPRKGHGTGGGQFTRSPGGGGHRALGVSLYRLVAAEPDKAVKDRLGRAARAYATGDLTGAANWLRAIAERHPDPGPLTDLADRIEEHTKPRPPPEPSTTSARRTATSLDKAVTADDEHDKIPGQDAVTAPKTKAGQKVNYFGNTADTRIVTFADGSRWVRKRGITDREMNTEIAYSRISDVFGAGSPPVVKRTRPDGLAEIWQPFVPRAQTAIEWTMGADPSMDPADTYPEGRDPQALYESPQGQLIGLADKTATGADRHMGNWMVRQTPDGDVPVPIDNGKARFEAGALSDSPFALRLDPAGLAGQHPPADWDRWEAELEALRPEFDGLDMTAELDNALANYAGVRAQADQYRGSPP